MVPRAPLDRVINKRVTEDMSKWRSSRAFAAPKEHGYVDRFVKGGFDRIERMGLSWIDEQKAIFRELSKFCDASTMFLERIVGLVMDE